MNQWLYSKPSGAIIGVLFVVFLLVWESAYRFTRRRVERQPRSDDSQGLAIEAAILTLFGLLLGFTFSMSASRYEERKDTTLAESNAIGTAYLRTDLLPEGERARLKQILRGYLDSRVDYYRGSFNGPESRAAMERSDRLQAEAWKVAVEGSRAGGQAVAVTLLPALNEMFDLREKQLVVFENTVPQTVLWFLFALSILIVAVIGYVNAVHGEKRASLSIVFSVVVAITLFLILDMDRPRRGLIRLDHETMLRLKQTLGKSAATE